mmetsp:Transcript_13798/g.44110  ORF Transcript_13798/g.44110 Transcript_13798/m.44110 type:complete len:260 (-) Transcript_13798:713-1492(-)
MGVHERSQLLVFLWSPTPPPFDDIRIENCFPVIVTLLCRAARHLVGNFLPATVAVLVHQGQQVCAFASRPLIISDAGNLLPPLGRCARALGAPCANALVTQVPLGAVGASATGQATCVRVALLLVPGVCDLHELQASFLSAKRSVPVVLHIVVGAARKELGNERPFVTVLFVGLRGDRLLLWRPRRFLQSRVEVVVPPLAALLSEPVLQVRCNDARPIARPILLYHFLELFVLVHGPAAFALEHPRVQDIFPLLHAIIC